MTAPRHVIDTSAWIEWLTGSALATAVAIVYATARHVGAELLTWDAHFEGLPEVAVFPERA